ncbi:hypothetical protein [Gordonia sp. NPDC003585]|uniref:hypothetical protein n=1 Tax=Gordonia sp. NPDC003585 TaxID=3154275 RepID=UPI0033AC661F
MMTNRTVSSIAAALIIAALVVRGALVATGSFYWDDLILIGRASTMPILSWDYLGHSHDGHFMPAAFLVAGLSTVIAPVNWVVPAITLIVGQAIASVAVWRMIRIIAPRAGAAGLAALTFYLFTPMTVPAFTWWAAGLNTLPMQAAMAWIVGDAVLACRSDADAAQRRRIVVRSSIVFVVALAFFEKSLFVLPVALVAATLAIAFEDHPISPLATAVSRARGLWGALAAIFGVWLIVFFSVSDATAGVHSAAQTARLVWRSVNRAIVPSLVGGPWEWDRWNPSPPMGFASWWMILAGWLVIAAVAIWALLRKRGAAPILILAAAYAVLAQVPVMWNRSSGNTALELAQTMRYLPDTALVFAAALALLIAAPARVRAVPADDENPRGGRHAKPAEPAAPATGLVAVVVLIGLAVASASVSLAGFGNSWRDNPTGDYLDTAKRSLAAGTDHPMFDQALPLEILLPVAYPNNQISHTFGRLRQRPDFGSSTDRLQVLDTSGQLVAGAVTPRRAIAEGRGSCARPELSAPARLALDGPLIRWRWTIALSYCANRAGEVEFWLDEGSRVKATVQPGLHVIYVQLDGQGSAVNVAPLTAGLALHTGAGRVGEVVEARFLGE